MRLKGYTCPLMTSPSQVADRQIHVSGGGLRGCHKAQADWAAKREYKPHVQEDEIEAMSLEELTLEKMRKDPEYGHTHLKQGFLLLCLQDA